MSPCTSTGKTVLLVEDDLEIRDILQDLLEAEGYDVIPASHGRQALEFLLAAPVEDLPNLVVLDMMMPLVDGSQVLASMKSDPKLSPIPVVFGPETWRLLTPTRRFAHASDHAPANPRLPATLPRALDPQRPWRRIARPARRC